MRRRVRWVLLGTFLLVLLAAAVPAERPHRSTPMAIGRQPAARVAPSRLVRATTRAVAAAGQRTPDPLARCPWLAAAIRAGAGPDQLASLVLARMTLTEKIGEIVLRPANGFENTNAGVPRLCIPPLTLQDGPAGLGFGDTGVTQLPAPIALAATFDPSLAWKYGQVQGAEAHAQGIDVVQGPDLNLARVPENGRIFEAYGEDPLLTAAMGTADIQGIQSQGVLAEAKHLVAYNQETDRNLVNVAVSPRALQELYFRPFAAAVTSGHVGAVMCAYPKLNGVYQCEDPALVAQLAAWGFTGLLRTDYAAAPDPVAALKAGVDLVKPADPGALLAAVQSGRLPMAAVNRAVHDILVVAFRYHLVENPPTGRPNTPVASTSHENVALTVAEHAIVLLKNSGGLLPLDAGADAPIAVIGSDAVAPVTGGGGSSAVLPPFVSSPLDAIQARVSNPGDVTFADGATSLAPLPPIPSSALTADSRNTPGLTLTLSDSSSAGRHTVVLPTPVVRIVLGAAPRSRYTITGSTVRTIAIPANAGVTSAVFSGTLTAPTDGLYDFSMSCTGSATMTLDDHVVPLGVLDGEGGTRTAALSLHAGHRYRLAIHWQPFGVTSPAHALYDRAFFALGWKDTTPAIDAAVALAQRARTVVIFAADRTGEGFDRGDLNLPGDQNALISAVADVNPRTIVVLNTAGPVAMPWLSKVGAVVEAWYPGEAAGQAIAAVLFGDIDPSGHLPVTFPTYTAQLGITTAQQWPGTQLTVRYSEGLQVGYRYLNAHQLKPLFPFGYGLSYTTFALNDMRVAPVAGGYRVTLTITNTGSRAGTATPQLYLTFPAAAGEPPEQLAGFGQVTLAPGESGSVSITVPRSVFSSYWNGRWTTWPGEYRLAAGWSVTDLPIAATVPAPS
ncbi:MAG: glycoside hydrolase family 3 C-terminal domain-containing protein [Acidothermus cellulolyticus]|nr:glycoside hydrolase family 3 C-terminal domain-containing protein [Acidothermus cellulolyticus]